MSSPPRPGEARGARQPLFLARESFQRRRLMDAARLLPLVGVFLLILPILWGGDEGPGATTAREGLYIFAVWLGLIVAAGVLSRLLSTAPGIGRDGGGEDGGGT